MNTNLAPIIIALAIFFLHSNAHAAEWTWQDFKQEVTSPLREPARPITVWGGAIATTFLLFEDQLADGIENDTYEDKPLGSASVIGDLAGQLVPNALYAVGMAIDGYWNDDPISYRRANSMTKGTAYAVGLSTLLKYTVREPRPIGTKRTSFPSGHTTSATAFAAVVVSEHGWNTAGIGATLLASLSAYSRINDHAHYLHDVLFGAVIGTAYGTGIAHLNKNKIDENKNHSLFMPVIKGSEYGLAWHKSY